MGAKYRYTGVEEREVVTRKGTFVAVPGTVYDVTGPAVPDLRNEPDFDRADSETPAEEPTWQSPS